MEIKKIDVIDNMALKHIQMYNKDITVDNLRVLKLGDVNSLFRAYIFEGYNLVYNNRTCAMIVNDKVENHDTYWCYGFAPITKRNNKDYIIPAEILELAKLGNVIAGAMPKIVPAGQQDDNTADKNSKQVENYMSTCDDKKKSIAKALVEALRKNGLNIEKIVTDNVGMPKAVGETIEIEKNALLNISLGYDFSCDKAYLEFIIRHKESKEAGRMIEKAYIQCHERQKSQTALGDGKALEIIGLSNFVSDIKNNLVVDSTDNNDVKRIVIIMAYIALLQSMFSINLSDYDYAEAKTARLLYDFAVNIAKYTRDGVLDGVTAFGMSLSGIACDIWNEVSDSCDYKFAGVPEAGRRCTELNDYKLRELPDKLKDLYVGTEDINTAVTPYQYPLIQLIYEYIVLAKQSYKMKIACPNIKDKDERIYSDIASHKCVIRILEEINNEGGRIANAERENFANIVMGRMAKHLKK